MIKLSDQVTDKYRINLTDSAVDLDVKHFRNAAHDLFCLSCCRNPELEGLLWDVALLTKSLTAPVALDSVKEAGARFRKARPATIAAGPLKAMAGACEALSELAQTGKELTRPHLRILEQYEALNKETLKAVEKARKDELEKISKDEGSTPKK